jgi:hypothetical protein
MPRRRVRRDMVAGRFNLEMLNSKTPTRERDERVRIPGSRGLFGRDVAARLGKALDPLLDVAERLEAGFDRVGRDIAAPRLRWRRANCRDHQRADGRLR